MLSTKCSTLARSILPLAVLALIIPTAALADAPGQSGIVERAPELSAWVYWDGDLIVLTGPPLEQGCVGEGFQFPVATTTNAPSGVTQTTYSHIDEVWVFDDEGVSDPLEWLFGLACPSVVAGGPAPQPLAHGQGRVTHHLRADADGAEHGFGGVTARVTTTDGRNVHLRAHGEDGHPDFISYGG